MERARMSTQCHYCEQTTDLRPYGPHGSMVCFACATSTLEREAETTRNFGIQLAACGPYAVLDDTGVGPYPAKHKPGAVALLRRLREVGDE